MERCLQDNYYFREPSTQKRLLDILFVYSKLNPDLGYRQGMHELLAPLLWAVERDAIDPDSLRSPSGPSQEESLMLQALDCTFAEHDTFSLFCAVMQTAKSFYEMGETMDSSPLMTSALRIHEDLLTTVDPELADRLEEIEILPQLYLVFVFL